jgi:glucose/arabinose dehydrogenase
VQLGPDGYLWFATGDAASSPSEAPDTTSRLGKMLRVDPANPSTPPPNGLGGSADPYVWDYGLRNPYRFSFDRATGIAYIADAGDTLFEEVEVEEPGHGHNDYGWDRREGSGCRTGSSCGSAGTPPTYQQAHDSGYSVIIGGNVYRGAALPQLRGRYVFAIHSLSGRVMSFVYCGGAVQSQVELTTHFTDTAYISGFGEDQAGELYYVTLAGNLYQIVPN